MGKSRKFGLVGYPAFKYIQSSKKNLEFITFNWPDIDQCKKIEVLLRNVKKNLQFFCQARYPIKYPVFRISLNEKEGILLQIIIIFKPNSEGGGE